jgi:hypothetical protein
VRLELAIELEQGHADRISLQKTCKHLANAAASLD